MSAPSNLRLERDGGAEADLGCDRGFSADGLHAMLHVDEPIGCRCDFGRVKALAVVANHDPQFILLQIDVQVDVSGTGVLDGVVEGFLHDEEDVVALFEETSRAGTSAGNSRRSEISVFARYSRANSAM